jgi:O-antigen ligase
MLRDHPVLGSGLSGFARTIGPYRGGVYQEDLIYPHNIVLNFWTETGLLGVAAFGWLLIQAFRSAYRGWRAGADAWRPLQLGVLLAMVAVVVHGMVDVPYWKNDLSLEFWALLGVSAAGLGWGLRSAPEEQASAQ